MRKSGGAQIEILKAHLSSLPENSTLKGGSGVPRALVSEPPPCFPLSMCTEGAMSAALTSDDAIDQSIFSADAKMIC